LLKIVILFLLLYIPQCINVKYFIKNSQKTFKLITSDITNSTTALQLFTNKFTGAFNTIKGLPTALTNKTITVGGEGYTVSKSDMKSLQQFVSLQEQGIDPTTALGQSMTGASEAAEKAAKGMIDEGMSAEQMTACLNTARASTVALKAETIALNIGIQAAIIAAVFIITKLVTAYSDMAKAAAEATSQYKEQSSTLEEYKTQITELKTALEDNNISYADARDKRSQLLDIQKELIDTYGVEANGIDLVNGSLDEQIEKLDTLNEKKVQEWKNEVNKLSVGQQIEKWGGAAIIALNSWLFEPLNIKSLQKPKG
jgi:hypothetical protein